MSNLKGKIWIYWLLGFVLMLATLYYQHMTGPTYEKRISFTINNNNYKAEVPRSHGGESDCEVALNIPDTTIAGAVYYKRYKVDEEYTELLMQRTESKLSVFLPHQPPAGKLEYSIVLKDKAGNKQQITGSETVVIRFKGDVPLWILRIHIFFMFLSMLLSNVTGMIALFRHASFVKYALITAISLLIGGFIMGPIVQYYAFGVWWAGFPVGWDLTDNKLLIAFLVWSIAWLFSLRKPRYLLGILACIVLIIMYAIPHSTMGSELDYKSGKIGTSKEFKL